MADNHTQDLIQSVSNAETWRTLYPYTKMDLPVIEVKDMAKKYTDQIHDEVKNIVGEIFGGSMKKEAMKFTATILEGTTSPSLPTFGESSRLLGY